ncbi:glycine cleavage system transcriptional repressor [Hamadaea flava]|uniref:Glycine cleavage system protein R n=1 Tax=Hamadaea flava TaxID=1742688 RepID=A0ABV8LWJ1_9ACTN|nr:ACT domain-containing protein [Hamadaea flava]MCP2325824.1 glycine cleavage system transcriptional repressor [Hamadaea flava]
MTELAVTVLGHDRPGIVADVAGVLSTLGANLTDSTMTRLRGHFAMTLICAGELSVGQVEEALRPLTADGRLLVGVREVGADEDSPSAGVPHLVSVHGADRLGIVAAVTRALAEAGGNITDLSTRLVGPLYVLVAEVELPKDSTEAVAARLAEVSEELGVEVTLRRTEADLL